MMAKRPEEKVHNPGSDFNRESSQPDSARSVVDDITDMADSAIDQVARLGRTAMEKDNRSKVAAGAAVGAVASIFLPFITIPFGLIAGAGYVAYREANKRG